MSASVLDPRLVLEYGGQSLPLIPVGDDRFYAEITATRLLPVAFVRDTDGKVMCVMLGGEPYHRIELDLSFQPDIQLWESFEGLYKDPSNSNREEMYTVRLQNGELLVAEGTREVPCKAVNNRCFLSDLGLFEFEDTHFDAVKVLVWGKAVRYYPVEKHIHDLGRVIRYLIDVPVVPQRVN